MGQFIPICAIKERDAPNMNQLFTVCMTGLKEEEPNSAKGASHIADSSHPVVTEVLIDQDCPMCRAFGSSLSAQGFAVTPRRAAKDGSIEVRLADGQVKAGYFAMLEIARQRGSLPGWLHTFLATPPMSIGGRIGYRIIANNRAFLSRFWGKS